MNQEINEASVAEAQQKLIAALLGDDDEDDVQPTGEHFLLEIIRQEEERELQYMVSSFALHYVTLITFFVLNKTGQEDSQFVSTATGCTITSRTGLDIGAARPNCHRFPS